MSSPTINRRKIRFIVSYVNSSHAPPITITSASSTSTRSIPTRSAVASPSDSTKTGAPGCAARRCSAVATTAVTISSSATSKPAPRSVPARSARLLVVVFVISRNGTASSRSRASASTAPGSASHETARTPSMSSNNPSNVTDRSVPSRTDPERMRQIGLARIVEPAFSSPRLVRGDVSELRRKQRPTGPHHGEGGATDRSLPRCVPDPIPGSHLGGQRSEGQPSHRAQDGSPLRVGWRIQEETGDAPRRVRHDEDAGPNRSGDVLLQLGHRGRDQVPRETHHLGREHLLFVEPLPPAIVETAHGEPLEQESALDQAGVHPEEESRIGRVVPASRHRIDA